MVLLVAVVTFVGDSDDAAARTRHGIRRLEHRVPVPSKPTPRFASRASSASSMSSPGVDRAVSCSCTSPSSCPEIGELAIRGYRPQALYCNQLNGVENVGVHSAHAWYYQCAELANRWLVESVGAPAIAGNADQMCDFADRRAFDVHKGKDRYEPVPGDLLVWGGYVMGHVGVVTSVSSSSMVFANQNYGHAGLQYPVLAAPRIDGFFGSPRGDRGLHAKCIIHPLRLAPSASPAPVSSSSSGPCVGVAPPDDGAYCGGSRQSGFAGGDASTLYTCAGGRTTALHCRSGCRLEPVGRADHCL